MACCADVKDPTLVKYFANKMDYEVLFWVPMIFVITIGTGIVCGGLALCIGKGKLYTEEVTPTVTADAVHYSIVGSGK